MFLDEAWLLGKTIGGTNTPTIVVRKEQRGLEAVTQEQGGKSRLAGTAQRSMTWWGAKAGVGFATRYWREI